MVIYLIIIWQKIELHTIFDLISDVYNVEVIQLICLHVDMKISKINLALA